MTDPSLAAAIPRPAMDWSHHDGSQEFGRLGQFDVGVNTWRRRRQAVEPAIGHLKSDNRMDRCWLQGSLGDALHTLGCAAGYNLRWLLRSIARLGIEALFLHLLLAAASSQRAHWRVLPGSWANAGAAHARLGGGIQRSRKNDFGGCRRCRSLTM